MRRKVGMERVRNRDQAYPGPGLFVWTRPAVAFDVFRRSLSLSLPIRTSCRPPSLPLPDLGPQYPGEELGVPMS
jgi:hypothetical protein